MTPDCSPARSSGLHLLLMDRIFIRDLRVETIIGIYEHERETPQTVVLDIDMAADIAKPAASENIEDALNYHTLSLRLTEFLGKSLFLLIETMAEAVVSLIRREFGVNWVRLRLHKPDALPGSTQVGLVIERGQHERAGSGKVE